MFNSHVLFKEIDYGCPLAIFETVHEKKWAILFDSALYNKHYGRYSYIAFEPFSTLLVKDGVFKYNREQVTTIKNPFIVLQHYLKKMPQTTLPELPPFQGGAAGAFSYDLNQYLESITAPEKDDTQFPDMALGFYDVVISFDHHLKKAYIVSTGWPELTCTKRRLRASKRMKDIELIIEGGRQQRNVSRQQATMNKASSESMAESFNVAHGMSSNFNKSSYQDAVDCVIKHILDGDIFEANISQRFTTKLPPDLTPFKLYKQLRKYNPAPFAAFLNLGETYVVSASPERFLQVSSSGFVETRPIKGTRPRGRDIEHDKQLAEELLNSEKDHAENIMIVDLLRNDISKVCKNNSIKVMQLCGLERYKTVHHLVSVVTGKLHDTKDAIDLLVAAFPGGSITGAPKIQAMKVIATIEPTKRGIYCGSLGFIGFDGAMDTSIVIRSYTIKDNVVTFQTGGAVVVDSKPEDEYLETLTKSHALHQALGY